mmetsp:Transcript_162008/g.519427  ORF Transcript_162008/g.519427 Transcript_162008/m.519427 type:complete len:235 (-) Transcript_162008:193-897(-)
MPAVPRGPPRRRQGGGLFAGRRAGGHRLERRHRPHLRGGDRQMPPDALGAHGRRVGRELLAGWALRAHGLDGRHRAALAGGHRRAAAHARGPQQGRGPSELRAGRCEGSDDCLRWHRPALGCPEQRELADLARRRRPCEVRNALARRRQVAAGHGLGVSAAAQCRDGGVLAHFGRPQRLGARRQLLARRHAADHGLLRWHRQDMEHLDRRVSASLDRTFRRGGCRRHRLLLGPG